MNDLFAREQEVLDKALEHLAEIQDGAPCRSQEYAVMVKEYGQILRLLRIITKVSDKTTVSLNTRKLDLQDQVYFDALTGIYNRRFLEESLAQTIKTLSRAGEGCRLSVLMVDVDFFKSYNDLYGHSMGDECLRTVTKALNECLTRAGDFIARYGGEEFAVVLPNTDDSGACMMAGRMIESIAECDIPHEGSAIADRVTVSIGVTSGTISPCQSGEDYIKQADKALYMSKQNGRNRSSFINLVEGPE